MGRIVTLKQASNYFQLSEWELRTGAKAGKYPHMRAGSPNTGKLLFDLDLLEDHIKKVMISNIKNRESETKGVLRMIKV